MSTDKNRSPVLRIFVKGCGEVFNMPLHILLMLEQYRGSNPAMPKPGTRISVELENTRGELVGLTAFDMPEPLKNDEIEEPYPGDGRFTP